MQLADPARIDFRVVHRSRVVGWPRHSEESLWHSTLKGAAVAVQLQGPPQEVVQLSALMLPLSFPGLLGERRISPTFTLASATFFPKCCNSVAKVPSRVRQGPVSLDFELLTPLWPGFSGILHLRSAMHCSRTLHFTRKCINSGSKEWKG